MADEAYANTWKSILWAEWQTCNDTDYARRLVEACGGHGNNSLGVFKSSRPFAHEVEAALYAGCNKSRAAKFVWEKRLKKLEQTKRKLTPVNQLIANLQDHHWFERFLTRHVLLHRGGEAILSLQALAQTDSQRLKQTTDWLVESIGAETTQRLAPVADEWACPICLVRCGVHWIDRPWQQDLSFYGCRQCCKSSDLLHCPAGIVAQLDSGWPEMYQLEDNTLYGNWSNLRSLFDFDQIEIIRATDEDVERFAVQAGNDTDPTRQPHYQHMLCYVGPKCDLSKNSLRILESTFGKVEQTYDQ